LVNFPAADSISFAPSLPKTDSILTNIDNNKATGAGFAPIHCRPEINSRAKVMAPFPGPPAIPQVGRVCLNFALTSGLFEGGGATNCGLEGSGLQTIGKHCHA
jgi:hypothetical protein